MVSRPSLYIILSPKGSLATAFQTVNSRQAAGSQVETCCWVCMCQMCRTWTTSALTSRGLWFRGARWWDHWSLGAVLFFSIGCTSCWSESLGIWILSMNGKFHCRLCCFQKANELLGLVWRGNKIQRQINGLIQISHYYSWNLKLSMVEKRVRVKFFLCQPLRGREKMVAVSTFSSCLILRQQLISIISLVLTLIFLI